MTKMRGYLSLIRPMNCTMMGFAVLIGEALASLDKIGAFPPSLAYGFATGFTLTAASMAINDYHDRGIDAVNEPNRPIPSGIILPRIALVFAFAFTIIGFLAAYLTNTLCLITALAAWMVFVVYTTVGKRSGLPGNFLVSICVAMPFIYGSIALTNTVGLSILIFAFIAFLSNTGREITKGIVDVEGDRAQNVTTLAIGHSERTASRTAVLFYLSAVLISPLPYLLHIVSFWFIPLVVVTDFGLVFSSLTLLRDYSRENARKVKNVALLWFVVGLLAFLAGAF